MARKRVPDPTVAQRAARKAERLEAVIQAAAELRATEERTKAELDESRERLRAALRDAYEAGSSYARWGNCSGSAGNASPNSWRDRPVVSLGEGF